MNNRLFPTRFYRSILLRLLLLALTIWLFSWSVLRIRQEYLMLSLNAALLISLQIWLLFRYLTHIDRQLSNVFYAVLESDTPNDFLPAEADQYGAIRQRIFEVMEHSRKKGLELQAQELLFREVLKNAPVGILIYNAEGNIELQNPAFAKLLKTHHFVTIAEIENNYPELMGKISSMKDKTGFTLRTTVKSSHELQADTEYLLAVKTVEMKFQNTAKQIVIVEDIENTLTSTELESWKKLISVLRHEILNSLSPVPTLTQAIKELHTSAEHLTTEEKEQRILSGLNTIEETSRGILEFVKQYKLLTSLPEPKIEKTDLNELLLQTLKLQEERLCKEKVELKTELPEGVIYVLCDPGQTKQVFLNLLANALDAIQQRPNPEILVSLHASPEHAQVSVSNNGSAIEADIQEKVFIPFFTTKKEGKGIGLSLSRLLLQMQKGRIWFRSEAEQTQFSFSLPLAH